MLHLYYRRVQREWAQSKARQKAYTKQDMPAPPELMAYERFALNVVYTPLMPIVLLEWLFIAIKNKLTN